MDYEKKYKEALERAKDMLSYKEVRREDMEYLFPELTESEDERVRKNCIHFLELQKSHHASTVEIEECIDWLEKQWEQKVTAIDDFKAKDWYVSKVDGKIHNIYYSVDKVEPKFHKGDWIINPETGNVLQIKNVLLCENKGNYEFDNSSMLIESVDRHYRQWTIKDAKDGDVLVIQKTDVTYESIFIFNKIENNRIIQHLHYLTTDADEKVCEARSIDGFIGFVGATVHPATKEQRDLLFQKMHEAGYEWSPEKKELKKIDWSKHIKYEPNSPSIIEEKPAWSEEDEQYLLVCKNALAKYQTTDKWDASIISCWLEDKLKSLRPQNRWKSSDELMEKIENLRHKWSIGDSSEAKYKVEAYDELIEMLKEE